MVDKNTFYDINVTPTRPVKQGEINMADIITGTTTGFVNNTPDQTLASLSDIRREAVEHTLGTRADIKDSRFDVASRIGEAKESISKQVDAVDDTITAQLITMSRESADNRAQLVALGYQVRDGFQSAGKDSEINALKTQVELAKQTTYLSDKIDAGNAKTQDLINSLKEADLNRMLIERNAALVEEVSERRHWRHFADQGQWAALNSQLQAFQSQLQETRQGVTNFGTMTGNAGRQQATNNVA